MFNELNMKKIYTILFLLIGIFGGCSYNKHDVQVCTLTDITMPNKGCNVTTGEDGVYFAANNNIVYMDIATKTKTLLCNRVECLHNDDTCDSFFHNMPEVIFTNATKKLLFVVHRNDLSSTESIISVCNMSGSERKEIATINSNQTLYYSFVDDGENIYYVCMNVEDGNVTYIVKKTNYISGKSSTILSSPNNLQLLTAYNNKLIFWTNTYSSSDTSYFTEMNNLIFEFDITTGKTNDIVSYTSKKNDQEEAYFLYNNYMIQFHNNMNGKATVYKTNLLTGEKMLLSNEYPFYGYISQNNYRMIIDNVLYLHLLQPMTESTSYRSELYGIDLNSGEIKKSTLQLYNYLIEDGSSASEITNYPKIDGIELYSPIIVSDQINDYYIVHTALTSYLCVDELDNFINGYCVDVIEIVPKNDFFNNNMNYYRIR